MKGNKLTKKELEHFNFYVKWKNLSIEDIKELKSYLEDEKLGSFYKKEFKELTVDETQTIPYQPSEMYLFEPLELFRIIDTEKNFVISNSQNPLLVIGHLKGIEVGDKFQYRHFLETIYNLLKFLQIQDSVDFTYCLNYIDSLIDSSHSAIVWERESEKREKWSSPSFYVTEVFLEKLPDNKSKINHLKELFIECEAYHLTEEANGGSSDEIDYKKQVREDFLKQCEIQIARFEKISELEQENDIDDHIIKKHKGKILETHKDFSLHRSILLLKHLAPRLTGCDQNKVAEVISFLTGFTIEGARQGLSEIKNKFVNNPEAYNKDVKIVCNYLNLIGLNNEAEKLKQDSGEV